MYVTILYYDHEPCRVFGPFPTEEAAMEWLDTRDDASWDLKAFGAATIHELRTPTQES